VRRLWLFIGVVSDEQFGEAWVDRSCGAARGQLVSWGV